jgi:hypothetical protein
MKTVQMTPDESLVKTVDSAAKKLGKTRSAFARKRFAPPLKKPACESLRPGIAKATSASRSSAESSAIGSQSRFGVTNEARYGGTAFPDLIRDGRF